MSRIRRILCPVDFSESSRRALDRAAALAGLHGASLAVLYVSPYLPVMDVPPPRLSDARRAELTGELQQFTGSVPAGIDVDTHIVEAEDVARAINQVASELGADLMVMGSHGPSGFKRLMLGSVTENTLPAGPCPVLVVPPPPESAAPTPHGVQAPPAPFRRILCAIDFSPMSAAVLNQALALAEQGGGELTLIHVIEVPPELRGERVADLTDVDRLRAAEEARCLRALRELVPDRARVHCTVYTLVGEGPADEVILKAAAARQADLIVMGVRGHGVLDLVIFGSKTRHVVRAAPCPVLVVHEREVVAGVAPATAAASQRALGE
jgi:nucleotide-binding universal stress UspA family protein